MVCDESLYRQYLSGDDAGLEALMKKYGDPLTLYIDGYLHDVHEAEELMLDVFAYLLWTAGCFWRNDSLASPAFWCDMLLTLAILGLLPATRKAVGT